MPLPISFLSDFGHDDEFVGVVHGVIARIAPDVLVIDIGHDFPRGDVQTASLALLRSVQYLPEGIALAVVDPGVGSGRRGIVVATAKYSFVGPDNGLFSFIYNREPVKKVISIQSEEYLRRPISPTFHGRDVFAPVAAWLAQGTEPEAFGPEIGDY
ncbi:MAG: SAM-dependent chlorinase/fluorinase, partial [Acidobacteria bacterium]|nr:SAM-dependent chlorinase/fluorinase [Acidobacteriota bacterium]